MRFNYANFKEREPGVEAQGGYGNVQAWGVEYYRNAMEELEGRLAEMERGLETQKELRMPAFSQGIVKAEMRLLREILGVQSSDTTVREKDE